MKIIIQIDQAGISYGFSNEEVTAGLSCVGEHKPADIVAEQVADVMGRIRPNTAFEIEEVTGLGKPIAVMAENTQLAEKLFKTVFNIKDGWYDHDY